MALARPEKRSPVAYLRMASLDGVRDFWTENPVGIPDHEGFATTYDYVRAFDNKREWQATCDYDLKGHLPFLCEKTVTEPVYLTTYSAETQRWIAAELQKSGVTAPDCKLRKT